MPVYEYFCRTCNTRYDKLRPLRDADAPAACPSCQEENSVRTLSLFVTVSSTATVRTAVRDSYVSGGGCACGGPCGCASKN